MDEPLYPHHHCDACQFLGQHDGYHLYYCTQPGQQKPYPVLVAVVEHDGGQPDEKLARTAQEAKRTPLLAEALRLANEHGWFLGDQPTQR